MFKKNKEFILVFLVHFLCMIVPYQLGVFLMFITSFFSVIQLLKNNYNAFIALLLFGAYNASFPNVYNIKFLGISLVYSLIFLMAVSNVIRTKNVKIKSNLLFFIIPIILLIPINIIFGFINRYTFNIFLIDLFCFITLYYFVLFSIFKGSDTIELIIKNIKSYVLFFYPLMVIVSSIIQPVETNELYFDEFSKFHAISIIPIIYYGYYSFKQKLLLSSLNILGVALIALTSYFSSLNLVLMVISIIVIIFKSNSLFNLKTVFYISAFSILLAPFIYNSISVKVQHKINQIPSSITSILSGDIKQIPRSPRIRVLEFLNSNSDIAPYYFLTGKGYGSYFTDKTYSFKDYGIPDIENTDAYEEDALERMEFPKGHGFFSYALIKIGWAGIAIISIISVFSLFIKHKDYLWLTVSTPFYIVTTLGFGFKNFLFIGLFLGIILILYFNPKKLIKN